jgi:hypothetical protein
MNRQTSVNQFVIRVTNNEALRKFFTLILLSKSNEQKQQIENTFWLNIKELDKENRERLLESYRLTLPQLLTMSRDLRSKVNGLGENSK